jgi:hypothetical protein
MRRNHAHGAQAGHRTETRADHRNLAQHGRDSVPVRVGRHVGASDLLDGFDAAASAGSVHQANHGDAQAAGQFFAVAHFVTDGAVVRAPAHGEIVPTHHYRPAVDFSCASNKVGRSEGAKLTAFVVKSLPCKGADFVERIGIQKLRDSFANCEASGFMLPLDVRGAAHLARDGLAPPNLVDFRLPAHSVTLYAGAHVDGKPHCSCIM